MGPGDAVAVLRAQNIEGFQDHQRKRSLQNVGLFLHEGTNLWVPYRKDGTAPFVKQQEILRDLSCVRSGLFGCLFGDRRSNP